MPAMNEELTRQGERLLAAAEKSRRVLELLSRPAALGFNLPVSYTGSLYRFAPLAPAHLVGASEWLALTWWKQRSPADFDALRNVSQADDQVPAMIQAIRDGQGGMLTRFFGGAKKQAAEAASAELASRLVAVDADLGRVRALLAEADAGVPSMPQAFETNALGLQDAAAVALTRFAGERWEQVTWEKLPATQVAAYQQVLGALNTPERAQLMSGMGADMEALKTERARLTLRDIPVDKLRELTSGTVRTAPLMDAGIGTVDRVLDHTPQDLTRFPGIGETTAAQLHAAAQRLLAEAAGQEKETLGEYRTPAAERMLIGVDRLQVIDAAIPQAELRERLTGYAPLLNQGTPIGDFYVALGEDRTDYDQLLEDLTWCQANGNISVPPATWLTADEAWQRYLADPSTYQALLAHYLGNENHGDDYLPAEINERIRKYPINLEGLAATLRGYQNYGAKFMLAQKKVILGDEMGLGKTMQSIAALTHLHHQGKTHFVVICPASVVINWARELQKFSQLTPYTAHGDARESQVAEWKKTGGVLIATYDGARLYTDDSWPIDALIADEAHLIKNPAAQRSQAVAALVRRAEYAVLLSGTPMENRVSEFVTLVDYLQPALVAESGMETLLASEFRTRIAPAYLRRNQKDVLSELPDMTEHRDWVELTGLDTEAYRGAVAEGNFALMRRVAWAAEDSAKLTRLLELVDEAEAAGRKVLVFSFFLSVLERLQKALGERSIGLITGSVEPAERQGIVDQLGEAAPGSVLLAQITAAGAGLNIQSASVVILCEPQFKPTIESQAIARAHRMGQLHTVDVFRLLGVDTVDERMLEILGRKSQLFDEYARISAAKESASESVDISDAKLATQIIADERRRLGLDLEATVQDVQGTDETA